MEKDDCVILIQTITEFIGKHLHDTTGDPWGECLKTHLNYAQGFMFEQIFNNVDEEDCKKHLEKLKELD